MQGKINQKIESGLNILAKIIAREEIKRQLANLDKLVIFPSTGDIPNKEPVKIYDKESY